MAVRVYLGCSVAAAALLCLLVIGLLGQNPEPMKSPSLGEVGSAEVGNSGEARSEDSSWAQGFLRLKAVIMREEAKPSVVAKNERLTTSPSARSPRLEVRGRSLTFEESFIDAAIVPAQESQAATGVPASVTIAQAILESDWGRSGLSTKAKNYFGIKARPDPGPAGVVYMDTWESIGGKNVTMNEPFRAYNTMEESFIDHGNFFVTRPRYSTAFQYTKDPKQFAREIHKAGYATDPGYSDKLIALMDKFNLYAYDLK